MKMSEPIKNRYEFVVFFDVENGNPNGDPDAGDMPRVDPETGYGLVTDVCLKRKIRNYVEMEKEGEEGYVSANLARKTTGFSEDDLSLSWTAILNMFENDHSAAHGKMAVRELIVFKHDSELGCAPAHKLFALVKAAHKDDVTTPRSYDGYTVTVDEAALPAGVTCTRLG